MSKTPWIGYLQGPSIPWRKATRVATQNAIDKASLKGHAEVEHETSGEQWVRRGGSWFKNADGKTGSAA